MKALVLAGGAGTRLRPITHTSAKQLVPVANKPILFYGLEAIAAAGVTDVGIIVGDTAAEVRAAVGDGSRFGLATTYLSQPAPLGLAHAVRLARDFLGDEAFVMYLGDNFLVGGIAGPVQAFRDRPCDAQILLTRVPDPTKFGVARLAADGRVAAVVEKPVIPPSDLAVVGVYLFGPAVHEAVWSIDPSERGELEITDAIQWLLERGREVRGHLVEGYWKDTGGLPDLIECNRKVLAGLAAVTRGAVDAASAVSGQVVVEAGAAVVRSTVSGPVVIGPGAQVVDSRIGPYTSIGPHCVLERAGIEDSIVLECASIRGVDRVSGSLIGRQVDIARSGGDGSAVRLMVGDHSRLRLPDQ